MKAIVDGKRTGKHTSSSVRIAEDKLGYVRIEVPVAKAARNDRSKSLLCIVELSEDDGKTWQEHCRFTWSGVTKPGPDGSVATGPAVGIPAEDLKGKQVRCRIDTKSELDYGVEIR